ncbi:MAG: Npt1/Npt2 family nucleotide transporter [Deltaproteobacteria bacterium]
MAKNPLSAFMNIKRNELPLTLLMFSYFFAVITTFWIVKPLKKAMFIGFYKSQGKLDLFGWQLEGSQAELIAKVMNMVVAFGAVIVFSTLARRLRRQQLTLAFCAFCAVCFGGFLVLGEEPTEVKAWLFYLFGDLYNTLMVATFFAFLNDSFSPSAAKRTYGPIILGGVSGGAFGSMFVAQSVKSISFGSWMGIGIGITVVIAIVAVFAGRIVDANPPPDRPGDEAKEEEGGNPAIDGARIVFRSRYLLAIVAIVGLYEIISTMLDFQFTVTFEELLAADELGSAFGTTYAITNGLGLFVQLFLTSYILSNFRHTVALLIMPVAIMLASGAYLAMPILYVGGALSVSDNGLNYSINQSAREALYTPTSRDEKYKAKAFIDMFVQRFAKALAVGVSLLITTLLSNDIASMRYLSIITIALVLVWVFAARYAGNRFEELTADDQD